MKESHTLRASHIKDMCCAGFGTGAERGTGTQEAGKFSHASSHPEGVSRPQTYKCDMHISARMFHNLVCVAANRTTFAKTFLARFILRAEVNNTKTI